MKPMLTLQRRHSKKCPDKQKGLNYLKCRGQCTLRICGTVNGQRVRTSLKTRDIRRAARRLAEMDDEALGRRRKILSEAIEAFHAQHTGKEDEHLIRFAFVTMRGFICVVLLEQIGTGFGNRFSSQFTAPVRMSRPKLSTARLSESGTNC